MSAALSTERRPGAVGVRAGVVAGTVQALSIGALTVVHRGEVRRGLDAALARSGVESPIGVDILYLFTLVAGPGVAFALLAVGGSLLGIAFGRLGRESYATLAAVSVAAGVGTGLFLNVPGGRGPALATSLLAWGSYGVVFARLYPIDGRTADPNDGGRPIRYRRAGVLVAAGTVGLLGLVGAELVAGGIGGNPGALLTRVGTTLLVNGLLLAGAVFAGTAVSTTATLSAPYVDAWLTGDPRPPVGPLLRVAVPSGLAVGTAIVLADVAVFQPLVRSAVRPSATGTAAGPLAGLLVSLYGGITEELLLRYGLMTVAVAGFEALGRRVRGVPAVPAAILLASLLFGLSHLPATAAAFELTPAVVARALVLNGLGGVVFGWLYWRRGIEAAIVAHFAADVVLRVVLPALG